MIRLMTQYILMAAVRDKIMISFIVLTAVAISVSIFLGSASISEKDQFSLVFAASALRLGSVFTLVLFVVFFIRKSFDTRDVEFMLSRPITRFQFLTGHFIAYIILTAALISIAGVVLLVAPFPVNMSGFLTWALSVFIELSITASVAMFFSFVMGSAVSATLMVFAFYALARIVGGVLGVIAAHPQDGVMMIMEKIMLFISIVIPRFDLMGQGSWLLYGPQENINWMFLALQGLVFGGLIFTATLIDFKRKQF